MSRCVSLLALSIVFFLAAGAAAEDKKAAKVRVLLLGDSTVIGSVCREVAPKADHLEDVVRKLLAGEADLPPVEVVNRGVNGDTVAGLLARRYEKDVAMAGPFDFIYIRYGLNDVRSYKNFKEEFPAHYRKLIAKLRQDQPKAKIVLETVIVYLGEKDDLTINEQVRAVAEAEKLPVLDQYAPYAAELKHGPNMLTYRRKALMDIPTKYHALIPESANKAGNVAMMDNLLDVHLGTLPGWYADRHPNLAGYQVIGTQLAKHLAGQLRAAKAPSKE